MLTSGRTDFVGADIRGYMYFPVAGTYTIAMHSNDGVDLKPGDTGQLDLVLEEAFGHRPGEHPGS